MLSRSTGLVTASGASRTCCSAGCPSGSRLVANIVSCGQLAQCGDEVAHAGQQMFAVVEHEQLWAGAEQRGAGRQDVAVHDVQVERRSAWGMAAGR